jgi:enoyl-CoA hydratase/carnithine racemase
MTSQKLTAQQLLEYGAVAEVLPREQLLPRALEIAEQWATMVPAVLKWSHVVLNQTFKQRALQEVAFGHLAEGLGLYASAEQGDNPFRQATPGEDG